MEILIRDLKNERQNLLIENKTILDNAQFLRNQSKVLDLNSEIDTLEQAWKIVLKYRGQQ